jgi:uncharacterized phage protein (TIGR01671 family)
MKLFTLMILNMKARHKMRKIKFRGKRIDNGEWVYGYFLKRTICDGEGECSYIKFDGNGGIRVLPETVGQFTGLHDKNGKEIYRGDKLLMQLPFFKSRDSYEGIVKFKDGCFIVTDVIDTEYREPYKTYLQFSIVYLDELFKCLETEYVSNYGEVCKTKTEHLVYAEVIGNIHERSET